MISRLGCKVGDSGVDPGGKKSWKIQQKFLGKAGILKNGMSHSIKKFRREEIPVLPVFLGVAKCWEFSHKVETLTPTPPCFGGNLQGKRERL